MEKIKRNDVVYISPNAFSRYDKLINVFFFNKSCYILMIIAFLL